MVLANAFSFPGGTTRELAEYVHSLADRPVVMAVRPTDKLRAAKFSWAEVSQLRQSVSSYFAFRSEPGDDLGFRYPAWPLSALSAGPPTSSRRVNLGPNSAAAAFAKYGLPSLPNYLAGLNVEVVAKEDTAPEQIRPALLHAVGVTLEDGQVKVSARMIREGILGGCQEARRGSESDPSNLQRLDLLAAAVRQVSDKDLLELYEGKRPDLAVNAAPGSAAYNVAVSLARSLEAQIKQQNNDVVPERRVPEPRFQNVDPRRGFRVFLRVQRLPSVTMFDQEGRAVVEI